jgi:DnaJ family protein C protein 17
MKGKAVEEDDAEAPELRMFRPLHSDDLWLNCFIRPTRYHHSTKIFIKELTTPESLANLLSAFGGVDAESIVLSLKAPKKNADKRPKNGTALVPFKQIRDAFSAVSASRKGDRGLEGIEVG